MSRRKTNGSVKMFSDGLHGLIESAVQPVRDDMKAMEKRLNTKIDTVHRNLSNRIDQTNKRIDQTNKHVGKIEKRLDDMEGKIKTTEEKINAQEDNFSDQMLRLTGKIDFLTHATSIASLQTGSDKTVDILKAINSSPEFVNENITTDSGEQVDPTYIRGYKHQNEAMIEILQKFSETE